MPLFRRSPITEAAVSASTQGRGAGVGFRFLNEICALQERGDEFSRLPGRKTTTLFHTSHPQLCQALRRDKRWRQLSATMVGANKAASGKSLAKAHAMKGNNFQVNPSGMGYGGHFRAVQGFRYYDKILIAPAA
jgi:hypothetical protein